MDRIESRRNKSRESCLPNAERLVRVGCMKTTVQNKILIKVESRRLEAVRKRIKVRGVDKS